MREEGTYRDTTYLKNIYWWGGQIQKCDTSYFFEDCVMNRNEGGGETLGKDYKEWINSHKEGGVNIPYALVL